jgi:thiol-disulfide isomerase/thioredoxin
MTLASLALLTHLLTSGPLPTLDGRTLTAGDLRGRVVLIDVWATWCAPCLAAMPELKTMHDAHGDALALVGVNLDHLSRRDLRQWLARRGITWTQVHDGRGPDGPVATRLGVTSLPRTLLYDRHGRLVAVDLRGPALANAVARLVREGDQQ